MSEYDEQASEDFGNDSQKDHGEATNAEKSLIERYKTLERLMKKKKMMTQIDNSFINKSI